MKEELIKYDTAVLAKEKGFDPRSWEYWSNKELRSGVLDNGPINWNSDSDYSGLGVYAAPPQSVLQRWLRDIHGWHILVIPVVTMGYTFKILKVWKKDFDPNKELEIETPPYSGVDAYDYRDYEEALEAGLLESLKLV